MENLGYLALILALCLSLYAIVASLTGRLRSNLLLEVSAQRAVLAAWVLLTVCLRVAALSDSQQRLPHQLRGLAQQRGHGASLQVRRLVGRPGRFHPVFGTWILASYSFIAVYTARKKHAGMISYVVAIMMAIQVFFPDPAHFLSRTPFKS